MNSFNIEGNIPDVDAQTFYAASINIEHGVITSIKKLASSIRNDLPFILPGFVDSHVHIESSMLVPSEFARLAVVHGTVATVSDPHEIANVNGIEGVEYMIRNAATVNFKFYFGAPSCVPATVFETAGDAIDSNGVKELLSKKEIRYLSEMMNFPGVINDDAEVLQKIAAANEFSKPVDGHAPGLRGEHLRKYIAAGISTDHECFTKEEALEKLSLGMKIIIREGSAAKNFEALIDLLNDYPDEIMFCSDDKHPDSLVKGHINELCRRAAEKGINIFNIIKAACINPVKHYKLGVGLLNENDAADFVVLRDLRSFSVEKTFINGVCVADNSVSKIQSQNVETINRFDCNKISSSSLTARAKNFLINGKLPVIEALDGQLITNKLLIDPKVVGDLVEPDIENDVLKIVVVNRYFNAPPAISFIKNFGLKSGAIASSVAHDSHNIVAIGTTDELIADAINLIIEHRGGVSCVSGSEKRILPLPVAGLMSPEDGYSVAAAYTAIDRMAKDLGSTLSAPFMTLSFMALLVIPSLKLSDKGLFDGDRFQFIYP